MTVAAFPTAAVAFGPALVRRVRAHPGLTLLLRETQLEEGLRLVRTGEVDVALVADWSGRLASADRAAPDSGVLRFFHLIRDPLVLVVPRGHPAADPARPVDLDELRRRAVAGRADRRAVPAGRGPAAGQHRRGAPAPWEFEGLSTILSLVARGIGIAALPAADAGRGRPGVAVRDLPGCGRGPRRVRGGPGVERAQAVGGGDAAGDLFAAARAVQPAWPEG